MRILVTGGTGAVGRMAVARLVEHGHDVTVIGRRAGIEIEGAAYRQCDIVDFACVMDCVQGMEGIVHLAAIPNPSKGTSEAIFHANCTGTFNVYQAAANAGIKRIISASSINALGFNFGTKRFSLRYFPMDEAHPSFTTDPYSFSKQVMEEIGAYFWRRDGISSLFLRLPGVYEITPENEAHVTAFRAAARQQYQELLAMPEEQRRVIVEGIIVQHDRLRAERAFEVPDNFPTLRELPYARVMFGYSNFWASIDARDSAQCIEKGLLADFEGSHPVYVNDDHNSAGIPTETLVAWFYPDVPLKRPLVGTETLVSIDKARDLVGFEPEYSLSRWFES
ncbi:MAG: NAD-dependent epimerase/dehydratase family protein [Anaerolineae bacterium]